MQVYFHPLGSGKITIKIDHLKDLEEEYLITINPKLVDSMRSPFSATFFTMCLRSATCQPFWCSEFH